MTAASSSSSLLFFSSFSILTFCFFSSSFLRSLSLSSGADQRTHSGGPDDQKETRPNHEQGKENSHLNLDSKDEKSIAVSIRRFEQSRVYSMRRPMEETAMNGKESTVCCLQGSFWWRKLPSHNGWRASEKGHQALVLRSCKACSRPLGNRTSQMYFLSIDFMHF